MYMRERGGGGHTLGCAGISGLQSPRPAAEIAGPGDCGDCNLRGLRPLRFVLCDILLAFLVQKYELKYDTFYFVTLVRVRKCSCIQG